MKITCNLKLLINCVNYIIDCTHVFTNSCATKVPFLSVAPIMDALFLTKKVLRPIGKKGYFQRKSIKKTDYEWVEMENSVISLLKEWITLICKRLKPFMRGLYVYT